MKQERETEQNDSTNTIVTARYPMAGVRDADRVVLFPVSWQMRRQVNHH